MTKKYRTFNAELEIQETGVTESGDYFLAGYFVKYNSPARAVPYDFYEQIAPGCFGASLDGDIMAFYNHDTGFILGRVSSGTLVLQDSAIGLFGTITVNKDDADAMNVYSRVKRGDITGCSFGARVNEEPVDELDGKTLFTITQAELFEVSITPYPFYDDTTMAAYNAERAEELNKAKEFRTKMFNFKKRKLGEKLHEQSTSAE